MISFHPTISPVSLGKYLWRSRAPQLDQTELSKLFSERETVLVDSGRSALGVVIETLELTGATMLVPAYVCDVLYSVFQAYDITPIFIDIDPETYQPPVTAYTDEILNQVDAVILVATYGRLPDSAIIERLKGSGKKIIEDYAGRSPLYRDKLIGDARIYSLPKALPVPDGGLAVIPKGITASPPAPHHCSVGWVKNVLKLLPGVAPLIARLRSSLRDNQPDPDFDGVHTASKLTKTILPDYLSLTEQPLLSTQYTYCLPVQVSDPEVAIKKLRSVGISAEPIWNRPIVANLDVQETYHLNVTDFPHTMEVTNKIICVPLWHIKSDEDFYTYKMQMDKFCEN